MKELSDNFSKNSENISKIIANLIPEVIIKRHAKILLNEQQTIYKKNYREKMAKRFSKLLMKALSKEISEKKPEEFPDIFLKKKTKEILKKYWKIPQKHC